MTRPRTPGVGDDEVAAPPEDEVREPARAREADEGAQLEGVVDRGEQVGRAADAHRREPRERLVARRLDADPALDVGAGGDRVEAPRSSPRRPGRGARSSVGVRERAGASAAARTSSATASAAPGRPSARAAADIAACAAGSSSSAGRVEQRRRRRSPRPSTSRAAPASTRLAAFARWWPAACGYGHDDHRQAEGGHLGQRRRAGPPDDEVRGGERGQHLVAQERVRAVAPRGPRSGSASRPASAAA